MKTKNMYRDLMRVDGANMRDLNPKSQLHYGASVVGPAVATGAKLVGIAAVPFAIAMCDNGTKSTPDPIMCDCPDEATHLEVGASNVTCPADNCKHTGDCTAKVNEMLGNGTTKIVKGVGVSTADFDTLVITFNDLATSTLFPAVAISFKANVTEVRILETGFGISHTGKVLSVGCDETAATIELYLEDKGLIQFAQLQPQTKSTFLADKGNKGREWVAKLMNDRMLA